MRLSHLNERPSAFTAACAHAHAARVGRVAVLGVPGYRWRLAQQQVAFTNQLMQHPVRLQDARVRFEAANGRTAKAIRMAQSPIATGVKVSGVPPRGRPV